jgi:diguanylate cyclase (GGDEF)-like protein
MPEPTSFRSDRSLFSLAQIQHLMRIEFRRAQRYRYPIVCMIVAVDRLGHLRDLYGYDAKEEILERVIQLLKGQTRSSDFLGRMADDRLLAVVPHTDAAGAQAMAERILAAIQNLDFASEGRTIRVGVSIGIAHAGTEGTLFYESMLQSAADALEEAAAAGGSRFLVKAASGAAS